MKRILLKSIFAIALMIGAMVPNTSAQCSGGTAGAGITPTATYQTIGSVTAGTYYTFTATAGVTYEFTFCAGGGSYIGDPQLTILDNTGAFAGGYNDDACGLGSNLLWIAPTAGTYRVLVSRFYCNNDGTNHGTLAYRMAPPVNDLCDFPIGIGMPSSTVGNTTLATVDATPYGGSSNGVWYSIVGNGNQFTMNTCGGVTNYDSYLAIYTGSCSSLTGITVNDDACGLQSSVTWCTTAGTTYLIHVYGFSTGNGSFTLNASEVSVPVPTITPASAAICVGGSTILTASGSTSYSWDPGALSGATQTLSPATTTTYTVTGIDGATGCARTVTATVTVNALPTVTATSTASTVCAGTMVTLNGGGATTYAWDNGVTDAVAFGATATTTYIVTGTDANSCTNTASTTVTVNALPAVTATSTSSSVCAGGSVTLTGGGATSYSWDNSVIDGGAFTPSATTTYIVTGTDANSCTNTASTTVTVNALPAVTATSTSSSVCAGGSVTLTGGGATSYSWDNSVIDGGAFTPSATTTYIVTGTDVNSCTNTASTTVTVNALPTVTATSDAISAVCAGTMVTLNGGGATTYAWDNGVTDAVAFGATATTTYIVTGTDANSCTNTASVVVTVNALPTVTATSTSSSVCAGGNVTLTGGGATSYSWDNSVIDGGAFTPSATTTYIVTGTDVNSCTNTASTTVTVNALPTVTATSDAISAVCAGTMVTLNGGGATTYAWDNGVTDAVAFGATATTTYIVTGTDANSCTNIASVVVTVNALPAVTATSTSSSVCAGGSVTLTGGGATSYSWDNSVIDGGAFTPSATTTYIVTGTDVNSCTNTASTTVTVNALPTVTASVDNDTVCAGTMIILTGGGALSYAWDNGAIDGVAFAATDTITYSVTGTDANTCLNTASVNVLVYELPAVTLTSFTAPICLQAVPMALTGGSPTGGVYAGTGVSAGMFDPSVAGVGSFPITYSITDANTCSNSASSNLTVQDCTGIDENPASQEMNVYPNPTIGSFTISINDANYSELFISIVNIQGKEVFSSLDKNVNGTYNKNINLENLSKGVYFIKLNSGSYMRVQKLIIQ